MSPEGKLIKHGKPMAQFEKTEITEQAEYE